MKKVINIIKKISHLKAARCIFYLMTIFVFTSFSSKAQQIINVQGHVVNEMNLPVVAATITVENQQTGTRTNENGDFEILVNENDILTVSFVGFESQKIPVNSRTDIEVILKANSGELNEVVVVAYGKQKKISVTGAISSINTEEIKRSPTSNIALSLAGRLPGLTAIQRSGEPGRDLTEMFLRGQGTINTQSPLVLIDGIERELSFLDPNEIESVSILKDASSTALYGVRGANGVILIQTKRGTSSVPKISLSAETGLQSLTRHMQPVNSFDYANLRNLALANDGLPPEFSETALAHFKNHDDPLRYPNTNWYKTLLKDYSLQQRYNVNIEGATRNVRYFVNGGYLKRGSQFNTEKDLEYNPAFSLDRYNLRSNIDIKINNTLNMFLNLATYIEKQNSPLGALNRVGSGNVLSNFNSTSAVEYIMAFIAGMNATIPGPLTPDGEVVTAGNIDNPPYGLLNRTGYIRQTRANLIATYGIKQKLDFLTKGLSTQAVVSYNTTSANNLYATRNYEKYTQVIDPNLKGQDGEDSVYFRRFNNDNNTALSTSSSRDFNSLTNFQLFLNYDRTIGNHSLSGLALYQRQQNIINGELPFNHEDLALRLGYGFKNKYFIEFNGGYNGSEQFAKGHRFGFFPAFSGGWVLSEENFLKDNKTISFLKVRASYGEVGNDRIGSRRFLYLDNVSIGGGGIISGLGAGQIMNLSLLKNEDLRWEVAKKANVGIEIGLFNQLNLELDLFQERRDNILINRGTIPILNGLPNSAIAPVNMGVIKNKGFEVSLNYNKTINSKLSILSKVNFNFARNRQLFLDEPPLPEDYAYRYRNTGFRIGQHFGYIIEGYFKDAEDVQKSPEQLVGGHQAHPGDFKYRDLNADGIINEKDFAPIGYSNVPEYTYGASFVVKYGSFDFSFLIQGVANVSNYFSGTGIFTSTFGEPSYTVWQMNSWTQERSDNNEKISYPRLSSQPSPNEVPNSFYVISASYLRLKNAEIGYTLPQNIAKRIKAESVRAYLNGFDLLTFDKLPFKGIDPEQTNTNAYPINSIYNLGISITF